MARKEILSMKDVAAIGVSIEQERSHVENLWKTSEQIQGK